MIFPLPFKTDDHSAILLDNEHGHRLHKYLELKKNLFDQHIDRRWLMAKFVPEAKGTLLSVGVCQYNEFDHLAFSDPRNYYTVDLLESSREYAQEGKHYVCDVTDLIGKIKFDNLILFGVLEPPRSHEPVIYSLRNSRKLLLRTIDGLLNPGGYLILGPSLRYPNWKARFPAVIIAFYYHSYYRTLFKRSAGYSFEISKYSNNNLVLKIKKSK